MRPRVIFNSAMSLDGRVKKGEKGTEFLSRLDRYRVHELRGSVDAVMVDVETIIAEDPVLGSRSPEDKKDPVKIIVDAKCEVPPDSKILFEEGKKILVIGKESSKKHGKKLENIDGVEVIVSGEFAVNLDELLDRLYDKGIRKLLLEGEGSLIKRMLEQGYVDEVYISLMPVIMGRGEELFEKEMECEIKLDLEGILQYGDQVVLHYLVKK